MNDQPKPCKQCDGAGESETWGWGCMGRCSFCAGSGLAKQPRFRARCECGVEQPRWTTAFTTDKWMTQHLKTHRPKGNQQ